MEAGRVLSTPMLRVSLPGGFSERILIGLGPCMEGRCAKRSCKSEISGEKSKKKNRFLHDLTRGCGVGELSPASK